MANGASGDVDDGVDDLADGGLDDRGLPGAAADTSRGPVPQLTEKNVPAAGWDGARVLSWKGWQRRGLLLRRPARRCQRGDSENERRRQENELGKLVSPGKDRDGDASEADRDREAREKERGCTQARPPSSPDSSGRRKADEEPRGEQGPRDVAEPLIGANRRCQRRIGGGCASVAADQRCDSLLPLGTPGGLVQRESLADLGQAPAKLGAGPGGADRALIEGRIGALELPRRFAVLARRRRAHRLEGTECVRDDGARIVARLVPDPLSYWISTSDPKDNLRLEALVRKHGNLRSALLEAARG